ncbi:MAG TPA: NAD-dependent epimerase/dehydratase family protein [Polyangia bacterium]|nr:NAD-dependent epimerase/dehydratase family protein [Polyangia bacterium]
MKVIVYGASGMVGQGVLRECLLDPDVERVLVIGRRSLGRSAAVGDAAKLVERVVPDLTNLSAIEADLAGYDACFFCLGVASAGMTEAAYRAVTYDIAVAAGEAIARRSPNLTFVFVSGAGTDTTEKTGPMWARVKGAAENALLKMPFKAAYMFRPGVIQPLHGIKSRTTLYRIFYAVLWPLVALIKVLSPASVTTTERIGRAMLAAAKGGAPQTYLTNKDINALAASSATVPA